MTDKVVMNVRAVLSLSIVANVGLAGLVGYLVSTRPAPSGLEIPPNSDSSEPVAAAESRSAKPGPKVGMSETLLWRNIESSDYKAYVANLRAIGCPEETI